MKTPSIVFRWLSWVACAAVVMLSLAGCEHEPKPPRAAQMKSASVATESAGASRAKTGHLELAQEDEEETELAIILNPELERDEIPQVMREVVMDLAHQFPGTTFVAVAYMPTNPPQRVCTARFDAHTGKTTFRWEAQQDVEPLEENVMRI